MHTAQDIEKAIRAAANPAKAKVLSGFFKTGKGEYSENDIFIGVPVPVTRSIAKQYLDTPLAELTTLLHSPVHELRMAALLCMVEQFKKADEAQRTALYNTYLAHTDCIIKWDLVDLSASQIVGGYLEHRDHAPLYRLAQSRHLAMDSPRSPRRYPGSGRPAAPPRARPHTQSYGLDVARGRQERQSPPVPIPRHPLPTDAAHHATLCHRAIHTRGAQTLHAKIEI